MSIKINLEIQYSYNQLILQLVIREEKLNYGILFNKIELYNLKRLTFLTKLIKFITILKQIY